MGTATPSTASSEMASSALTLLEAVDLATVTLVAPWSRRLVACPLVSPGPSTTLTGSSPRLECLERVLAADVQFPRKDLKIKDLLYDSECPRTLLTCNS